MVTKVLKFSAYWCVPCKQLAPKFKEISENPEFKNIQFEEIDVDKNQDLAEKYKIMSVPTTIILDENDKILSKIVGNVPDKIENKIKEYL